MSYTRQCDTCGAAFEAADHDLEFYQCPECAMHEANRAEQLRIDNGEQCVFCKTRTAVRFEEFGRPICQWCTDDFHGRQLALAHGC